MTNHSLLIKKNILVAPLNWGLGHATRCIVVINELLRCGFNVIIASDGVALDLLKKEFPDFTFLELPSYKIEYTKKSKNFKWKIIKNSPKILKAIAKEKQLVKKWVVQYELCGIISDNRLGVRSKKIPSVIITHQLTVFSGKTTFFSTKIHQHYIKKFNECWVPDVEGFPNLSGKLGHSNNKNINTKYIGALSRFTKEVLPIKYQLLVLLSGPEPQRTLLEELLIKELENYNSSILFVKGKVEQEQHIAQKGNITFYNFMNAKELQKAINESEIVISRSGYTTILDLAMLEKKAFFIPTPGQTEQEYLAKYFEKLQIAPSARQANFSLNDLNRVYDYNGFFSIKPNVNWQQLFALFEGK